MAAEATTHRAFGLQVRCAFPLAELPVAPVDRVDATLALFPEAAVRAAFSGPCDAPAVHLGGVGTGETFRIERGRGADHLLELVGHAWFHLDAGARTIMCAPAREVDAVWRRFLLDTVLTTAALVQGFEAFHAAAFSRGDQAVAIAGGEGAGKSTLLAAALLTGGGFLCDDVLCVTKDAATGGYIAHPAPPVMNLPRALTDGTPADRFGRTLAHFGDESWIAVHDFAAQPCRLAAFVVLDRGGDRLTVERLAPSSAPLLQHSLIGGRSADRLRERFRVCGDLATDLVLLRVTARPRDPAVAVLEAIAPVLASILPAASSRR